MENGRVVRVTVIKEHPITRGTLCAKVNDYETRTYAPDRLLHPLRRSGAKGSGAFERIGWDEGLDTIASRFREIISADGPEAGKILMSASAPQCRKLKARSQPNQVSRS